METLNRLLIVIRETMDEWLRVRWSDLHFAEKETAVFLLVILLAISVFTVVARRLRTRKPGRTHVSLPAVLPVMRRSYASAIRHGALIVFALGIPFFAVALAGAADRLYARRSVLSRPPRCASHRLLQQHGDEIRGGRAPDGGHGRLLYGRRRGRVLHETANEWSVSRLDGAHSIR